jgi:beta-galactosidase/beta-glucuronidase
MVHSCVACIRRAFFALFMTALSFPALAATYGPMNVWVLQGGVGLTAPLPEQAAVIRADADWTMYAWVFPTDIASSQQLLAGMGDPLKASRYFVLDHGRFGFQSGAPWSGVSPALLSKASLAPHRWQFIAAVCRHDRVALYLDGSQVAEASVTPSLIAPQMTVAPDAQPWDGAVHFGGKVADFTVQDQAIDSAQLVAMAKHAPDPALIRFTDASQAWPVQTRQSIGMAAPQAASTLPVSRAPFSQPVQHAADQQAALMPDGADRWQLGRWLLASATRLDDANGARLSAPEYLPGSAWMRATVPGTVLTTLVDRGVYPDPAYGLNNMAIPESLNKHDWWYRTAFDLPADAQGRHWRLTFNGINYAAEVWVNGQRVGDVQGAFIRGRFDVTQLLHAGGRNAIAVRVSPPPHPGIAHEQSLAAGPGPNGGMQTMDGPTFFATEGWDWIPAIRDRNTGLWQDVVLSAAGDVRIGDTQVITRLAGANKDHADIDVDVPLTNAGTSPVAGRVTVSFGTVTVAKEVVVPPGGTMVMLRPSEFPQLALSHPHLWWPNGYGDPYLYDMQVQFEANGKLSDHQQFHFGIRQISYELSLFDQQGHLRRVLLTPDLIAQPGQRLMDVSHRAIRQTPTGWAYSLQPDAEHSPAVSALADARLTPYLVIRVNGVRIAIKGGSWGMDDLLKRISRERLEPYFRLQREAHLNAVRNWTGQNTEPVFYDLADKYGLLVLNDFWQSTENYNFEPQDDELFLRNAADTIRRYRNHPSIALWFGRNEGVPQPSLNERLDQLLAQLDGTRIYMPSSNGINLWGSGPYKYQPDEAYFTTLSKGFAVEVGTPSFPTLEAFKAMMPTADQWPISDDWAYHDWHQSDNGDVHGFMAAMHTEFGDAANLADFERKAQMLNYGSYRAIFEGLNAHLWTQNSGRLLWMSHPAWPSTTWQIYSHDYDTHAAYYGVKEASEPVHVQMNLPDHDVVVVNDTTTALPGVAVDMRLYAVDGHALGESRAYVDAAAVSVTPANLSTNLAQLLQARGVVLVQLQMHGADGTLLSRNFYWLSRELKDLQQLDSMPKAALDVHAQRGADGRVRVSLHNGAAAAALSTKLTLVDAQGHRVLPAYYSDNYVNLAPRESRDIDIEGITAAALKDAAKVEVRGWNVPDQSVPLRPGSH